MTADTPAPPHPSEGAALTVDELAARAGVTVRTVRFYSTRGLLPPPVLGPRRVGRYGPEHLSRLALIEELQRHGMTLAAIERYLEQLPDDLSPQDLAIQRALVASWAPEQKVPATRADLERRAGRPLTGGDLDRLAALDVAVPVDGTDGGAEEFRVDPGLLDVGIRLLDVPIAQETILAARNALLEHSRAAAAELARLFRAEIEEGTGTPEAGAPEAGLPGTGARGAGAQGTETQEAGAQEAEPQGVPVRKADTRPPREAPGADDGDGAGPGDADAGLGRVAQARSLSVHMQPLVMQALVTAFQRSLTQELRAWLRHEG